VEIHADAVAWRIENAEKNEAEGGPIRRRKGKSSS
jgi:hypothetical protein